MPGAAEGLCALEEKCRASRLLCLAIAATFFWQRSLVALRFGDLWEEAAGAAFVEPVGLVKRPSPGRRAVGIGRQRAADCLWPLVVKRQDFADREKTPVRGRCEAGAA